MKTNIKASEEVFTSISAQGSRKKGKFFIIFVISLLVIIAAAFFGLSNRTQIKTVVVEDSDTPSIPLNAESPEENAEKFPIYANPSKREIVEIDEQNIDEVKAVLLDEDANIDEYQIQSDRLFASVFTPDISEEHAVNIIEKNNDQLILKEFYVSLRLDALNREAKQNNNNESVQRTLPASPQYLNEPLDTQVLDPVQTVVTESDYEVQNNQEAKLDFINTEPGGSTSSYPVEISNRFILRAGTFIPVILEQAINSDNPGFLSARITRNVYDSINAEYLLIPAGSKVILRYNSRIEYGQDRIQVAVERIILPDRTSYRISGGQLTEANGSTGISGDVDTHQNAVLVGAILAGVLNYYAPDNPANLLQAILGGAYDGVDELSRKIIERELNRQPTITTPPAKSAVIVLSKDISVHWYKHIL